MQVKCSDGMVAPTGQIQTGKPLGGPGVTTIGSNSKLLGELYNKLVENWNAKGSPNLRECERLLDEGKVLLTAHAFLPISYDESSKQVLLIARDILEIGALWSVSMKDIPSFERYMAQLKSYYMDYSQLTESTYKYQLLGLNLLCLLSQNRVSEFHTELELLPPTEVKGNVYIRHPVSMEQYLMEGNYNKLFMTKGNVPAASYAFFVDILLETGRQEIALCMEKAYESIDITEAVSMLFLKGVPEVSEFASRRGWKVEMRNGRKIFKFIEKKDQDLVLADELACTAIDYARELEKIV
ncbi:unnamed protein product [Cyprideis torosa]|uniref:26S proteasome non-ATPase regulatory subunit 8 n=1 Tax=Cyprideis torosa TaxID=163714 RepID=A0A7R8ZP28_9CRUS|nr:unnamed protein product [Cyprideis torosa]CAG0899451.1 unnamed protein product [Cyprideis torosa]